MFADGLNGNVRLAIDFQRNLVEYLAFELFKPSDFCVDVFQA